MEVDHADALLTNRVDATYVFAQKQIDNHQSRETGKESATPDMLDRYLEFHVADPKYFTKNDVLIGASTSIVAGADTTWISLGSVMYYLHKNPKTLEKLRHEIDRMSQDRTISDPVTFEEERKMPYLNAVIKEAQRMHSPTGFPLCRVVPDSGATLCGRYSTAGVSTARDAICLG